MKIIRSIDKKTHNKLVNLVVRKTQAIIYLGLNLKIKSLISSLKSVIHTAIIAMKMFKVSIMDSYIIEFPPLSRIAKKKPNHFLKQLGKSIM
ncbi:hypothetical protein BKH44_07325 [Helicobacter sp. 13S00477-4]|nr:hypothetical protein BKH44_07325 [Helicobacter sp. 13S00477-4]